MSDTCVCFVCSKTMTNLDPDGNQPSGGSEFKTRGHYGSTVTDTMDGIGFAINVCDDCLRARQHHVLRVVPPELPPRPQPRYVQWQAWEDEVIATQQKYDES